jgi:hypothetical protein
MAIPKSPNASPEKIATAKSNVAAARNDELNGNRLDFAWTIAMGPFA